MLLLSLLVLATEAPVQDCPPKGSIYRERMVIAGVRCADDVRDEETEQEKDRAIANAFFQAGARFKDRPATPALQASIKRFMDRNVLVDGLSARYEFPLWRHPEYYCFSVNAKNQYGAYTGWTDYAVFLGANAAVLGQADEEGCSVIK